MTDVSDRKPWGRYEGQTDDRTGPFRLSHRFPSRFPRIIRRALSHCRWRRYSCCGPAVLFPPDRGLHGETHGFGGGRRGRIASFAFLVL